MPEPTAPIFLLGPTGCGKSAVAVALAEKLDAEIISADAYQVYRGMECLTAAPTAEERARVSHHLVACMSPAESNDAATHARRAGECLADIRRRGKRAIITGGSGLYVKFISHGISPAPPSDPALRAELSKLPLAELVRKLQEADPEGAAATNLQNPRYVERNLEIVLCGGKLLSAWKNNWQPQAIGPGFLLTRDTGELDARIARRARHMLREGALDEVARLDAGDTPLSATAEKTIGLDLIRQHLAGKLSLRELETSLALTTRQYAKRQRTWLRREQWLENIAVQPSDSIEAIVDAIELRVKSEELCFPLAVLAGEARVSSAAATRSGACPPAI